MRVDEVLVSREWNPRKANIRERNLTIIVKMIFIYLTEKAQTYQRKEGSYTHELKRSEIKGS